ncbi:unnamed protein product, partial [Didymodactylos carnosus]
NVKDSLSAVSQDTYYETEVICKYPDITIQGGAALKQYNILSDKRYIITKDSNNNVAVYDVLQAKLTENLGKVDYEEEIKNRTKPVFVPNWFSVDLKVGILTITLEESDVFSAWISVKDNDGESNDAKGSQIFINIKINNYYSLIPKGTNDAYAERVRLENMSHIPGHTPIFISEIGGRTLYRFQCKEAAGEPEQGFLCEFLPAFITNVIVKHQLPLLTKIPFVLHQQINNKAIKRDRLSASDMMLVKKVIEYIYERYILNEQQQQQQMQQPQQASLPYGGTNGASNHESNEQREADISKSIDHIELLCQEQIQIDLVPQNKHQTMDQTTMHMCGIDVIFPYKPYPCQIAMLQKIIKGLQSRKNCLLESPTGTGKTLTLLCAALAWQQNEIEQAKQVTITLPPLVDASIKQEMPTSVPLPPPSEPSKPEPVSRIIYCTRTHKQLEQVVRQLKTTVYNEKVRMTLLASRQQYCIHPIVSKQPNKNYECKKLINTKENQQSSNGGCSFYSRLKTKAVGDLLKGNKHNQLPKLFDIEDFLEYCQQTHGICPYYTSRMLIDSGSLVQIVFCPYNYVVDPRIRNAMNLNVNNSIVIIDEAHNIEDCAREAMKFKFTKYMFELAFKELKANLEAVDIILHNSRQQPSKPLVNANSGLQQTQTQRRGAAYSELDTIIEQNDLLDHLGIDQFGNMAQLPPLQSVNNITNSTSDEEQLQDSIKFLVERFNRLLVWFDTKKPEETITFNAMDLVTEFHHVKFIDKTLINISEQQTKKQTTASVHQSTSKSTVKDACRFRKALNKITSNSSESLIFTDDIRLFMEEFELFLSIIYADDYQFCDDYKVIMKTVQFEMTTTMLSQQQQQQQQQTYQDDENNDVWLDMSDKQTQGKRYKRSLEKSDYPLYTIQLEYFCLSPSVAFAKDLKLTRSIIFASGTLAPLATYPSELKIPFDFQMECDHVIDKQRTFITALSNGRNEQIKLKATYQNIDKNEFQDEIGNLILDICQKIPYGVLAFVPSYRFLGILRDRWLKCGIWDRISKYKAIFFEEKGSENFANIIKLFYEANGTTKSVIKTESKPNPKRISTWKRKHTDEHTTSNPTGGDGTSPGGGLLIAVCRGRASEGIDFSDNNARCVITIGIPYPNLKDDDVVFKRDYNTKQHLTCPSVMNGNDWYDSQAFRALNQALGRCIRHRNDWGALIIVDERFVNSNTKCNNKISKWIRQRLHLYPTYSNVIESLEKFIENMKTNKENIELQTNKAVIVLNENEGRKSLENIKSIRNDDEDQRLNFGAPSITTTIMSSWLLQPELPSSKMDTSCCKASPLAQSNYKWQVPIEDDDYKPPVITPAHQRFMSGRQQQKFRNNTPTSSNLSQFHCPSATNSSKRNQSATSLETTATLDIILPDTCSTQKSPYFQHSKNKVKMEVENVQISTPTSENRVDADDNDDDFVKVKKHSLKTQMSISSQSKRIKSTKF